MAADEAMQVAEFNRRLALELDHRVRNNLTGLISLVSMMRNTASGVKSFADAIEGRLLAMSHTQKLLADTDFRAVDLKTLVTSLMSAVDQLAPHRIRPMVDGPPLAISARQTPPLSMILVEWFTNSCKYGAHSVQGGRLHILWQLFNRLIPGGTTVRFVRLHWTETGGPATRQPTTTGLGTELVKGFVTLELRGRIDLRYPEAGADHMLEFPVE